MPLSRLGVAVALVLFGSCVIWVAAIALAGRHAPPKETPAYCIDPFASRDTGQAVYTQCSNVPMWSIKV